MIQTLGVTAAVFMIAASGFGQQNTSTDSANATVVITTGISITKNSDLIFGDIVADPAATGTVVISPAGTRTGTVVTFGNGAFSNASFDVTKIGGGNKHFTPALPASVTITSGANSMVVDNFTSNFPAAQNQQTTPFTLNVGATLHVDASQAAGTYSGTFVVTVVQQ